MRRIFRTNTSQRWMTQAETRRARDLAVRLLMAVLMLFLSVRTGTASVFRVLPLVQESTESSIPQPSEEENSEEREIKPFEGLRRLRRRVEPMSAHLVAVTLICTHSAWSQRMATRLSAGGGAERDAWNGFGGAMRC